MQFDDVSPVEAEQTFVVSGETLHGDHVTGILQNDEIKVWKFYVERDSKINKSINKNRAMQ